MKRWISYRFYDVVNSKSFFHDFAFVPWPSLCYLELMKIESANQNSWNRFFRPLSHLWPIRAKIPQTWMDDGLKYQNHPPDVICSWALSTGDAHKDVPTKRPPDVICSCPSKNDHQISFDDEYHTGFMMWWIASHSFTILPLFHDHHYVTWNLWK